MSKKQRRRQKNKAVPFVGAALLIAAILIGGLFISQQSAPIGGTTLRDTDTAFSVPTHVGQPASEFTAIDVDGQPYTMTPGDGRPKAIVFYMGYR